MPVKEKTDLEGLCISVSGVTVVVWEVHEGAYSGKAAFDNNISTISICGAVVYDYNYGKNSDDCRCKKPYQ